MKNIQQLILSILIFSLFAGASHAQDKTQQNIVTLMSFGDWVVRCEQVDKSSEPCTMTQKVVNPETKRVMLEANVAKNGNATLLTMVLPLGVYLPAGLELEVVGWEKRQYSYSFCATSGCFINELVDEKMVEVLRKKEKAMVTLYTSKDEKVIVPISIAGFLDAYKKL